MSCIVFSTMFLRLVSDLVVLDTNVLNVNFTDLVSLMRVMANVAVGVGRASRHPAPHPVDDYISRYVRRLDERRLAVMLVGQFLTVKVDMKKRDRAYLGWKSRWEHWRAGRFADGHTQTLLMYMPFVRVFEKLVYGTKSRELIG